MKTYEVKLSPLALEQMAEIRDYIPLSASEPRCRPKSHQKDQG